MLEMVTPNVWTVPNRLKMYGLDFSGKMTVVRLGGERLWLHSPIPISEELAEALAEQGVVRHIVAPSKFHHLFAKGAQERYPDAVLFGAPGLPAKRKDLAFDEVLGEGAPPAWGGHFDLIHVGGVPSFNEVLFFHRPSRTLIATDYFMNIHRCEGLLSHALFRLEGCYQRFAVPRFWSLVCRDRASFVRTAKRVAELEIERVVLCHGENVLEGAHARVAQALRRFLPADSASASHAV